MVVAVGKLEHAMMATLIGHELDEIVTDLAADSEASLPMTEKVKAYLQSRDHLVPVPGYLETLEPNLYDKIVVGDAILQVIIIDHRDDRLYLAFDTTEIANNHALLLYMLIGGGLVTTIVILISGIWLFKKFLLPVSDLAEEFSGMDVNDRKTRFEERYQKYEVGLIAQSIDQYLDRLDEFIEREQSFTAAASHELRTPVAVVSSAVDVLEMKGISTQQQEVINRIKEATSYMVNVIDSLLFLARNTYDVVEKTLPELHLHTAALRITQKHEDLASEKDLGLNYKCQFKIKARMSEAHLEIILGNLIRNAINNTVEGEVKVSVYEDRLSIKDTGHGIEPDEIELIVKRSYHSADSKGYGLGLYLVSKICDIYGMELKIDSEPGKGSEFSIIFPKSMISRESDRKPASQPDKEPDKEP